MKTHFIELAWTSAPLPILSQPLDREMTRERAAKKKKENYTKPKRSLQIENHCERRNTLPRESKNHRKLKPSESPGKRSSDKCKREGKPKNKKTNLTERSEFVPVGKRRRRGRKKMGKKTTQKQNRKHGKEISPLQFTFH